MSETKEDRAIDRFGEGLAMMGAAYEDVIEELANWAIEAVKSREVESREAFLDWVHKTINKHQWVIYTTRAQAVCLVSNNSGAMAEDFGAEGMVKDGEPNWPAMAYCAMERDLYEELDRRGFDVNDDETFEVSEEEEEAHATPEEAN